MLASSSGCLHLTLDSPACKAGSHYLPTVDHVTAEATEAGFRVCGWRTNDAKNDLPMATFLEVCEKVLKHAGYRVESRG